ncbi:MAG: nuclear transport factor 2 family protein [candidate division Zixibacteria bacterium]
MKRREFLWLMPALPASYMLGCESNSSQLEQSLIARQDLLFKMFHNREFETISILLAPEFSYIDGASGGKARGYPKRLERVYKYQDRNDMLPISLADRSVEVSGDTGWVTAQLQFGQARTPYGSLTQIFRLEENQWKLVRHHFSPIAAMPRPTKGHS